MTLLVRLIKASVLRQSHLSTDPVRRASNESKRFPATIFEVLSFTVGISILDGVEVKVPIDLERFNRILPDQSLHFLGRF